MKSQLIRIQSGKNQLSASLFLPEKSNKKLVILLPGYLDSKDYPHIKKLGEALADHGDTAISFNPTGTWDSEGDISEYSLPQYIADIDAVIQHMKTQGEFSKIFLAGHSFGAQIALIYPTLKNNITAVASIMPGRNIGITYPNETINRWKEQGYRMSRRDLPDKLKEYISYKVPYNFIAVRLGYDSLEYVKKLTIPVLYIAGEHDELHPVYDVRELYDATPEPNKLVVLEKEGHNYRKHDQSINKVNSYILDFFESL